jgi:hypothetical protein
VTPATARRPAKADADARVSLALTLAEEAGRLALAGATAVCRTLAPRAGSREW